MDSSELQGPRRTSREADTAFIVDVDGYEGPLDVLLTLAREQRVDLKQISIVQLADQYLAFIAEARRASLDMAAEYLVMAAWLAYLKSRLLLPALPASEEPSGEELAVALAFQLRRLEAMRTAGAELMARPYLQKDIFPRGKPEHFSEVSVLAVVDVDLRELLKAYAAHVARKQPHGLRIEALDLDSVDRALARLRRMIGNTAGWVSLLDCLCEETAEGLRQGRLMARSVFASTFAASLELVREGRVLLRQNTSFGSIYLRPAGGDPE